MGSFFAELKRRQMFRVAAAYAVVAWLLLQVVNNVAPVLDLPVWVARAFLLALVIGFPIALLFVWMRDLGPSVTAGPRAVTTKLDYVLAGGLILVIGLLSYQQLASSGAPVAQDKEGTEDTAQPAGQTGVSIAVLPFANVSGDASREFFSDGMTDEISGALAKVRDLRVIARTSAFEFKGQNRNVRAIGESLGANHLIEGSVRQAGNRVRITAQLVRVGDGVQLWSENYDRELTDIFAVQEDIARAIAGALRVPLGLGESERLLSTSTGNLDSYQQYLRARALFRARNIEQTIAVLEPVVARDPTYAPAWGLLGLAYGWTILRNPIIVTGSVEEAREAVRIAADKAQNAAREAIRLDPSHAGGYIALAFNEDDDRGRFAESEDLRLKALSLDPGEPESLERYAFLLARLGRTQQALRIKEQLKTLEPFVPAYNTSYAGYLINLGQIDPAIAILEGITGDSSANVELARAYAAQGRYAAAADKLLGMPRTAGDADRSEIEEAARLLRSAPAALSSSERVPLRRGAFMFVYAHVGAFDRILEIAEREQQISPGAGISFVFWSQAFAPLRKMERFKALVRRMGLVDYWRARGWPDLCRPVGADDFECE